MDAFDKLAKLAGASVESVGEGLPRTRAEAKALGVTRYFTGRPCRHGHVAAKSASSGTCAECDRLRHTIPERKERRRQHRSTPEYKERKRQYNARPEVRERNRALGSTAERKEYNRLRYASHDVNERARQRALSQSRDAVLFAIGQAEWAARMARAPTDIVPQCPEPQRSQLQALVDRIKVDPQAGKAVVGLLQTMRELRKAELAEMRAASEGGAT